MDADKVSGKVKEVKGKIQNKMGKAFGSDGDRITGKKDELVGKVQKNWGKAKEGSSRTHRNDEF